jgi:protein-disulfide isomerase
VKVRAAIAALAIAAAVALPVADAAAQRGRSNGIRSNGPRGHDWIHEVARTPEGGFRMGNPNARIKLVEYLSLTCPHCAAFSAEGTPTLVQDYVRSGQLSLEYRNYVLNGYDLAAAFLTRCASPRAYFEMTHYLLGHQPEWMGRIQTLTEAQRSELRGLQPIQAMQRIVPWLGLDAIGRRFGLTAAQQQACLSDQAAFDSIGRMQQAASTQFHVAGTPSFMINGQLVADAHDWATLRPHLSGL